MKIPLDFEQNFAEPSISHNDYRFPLFIICYFLVVDLIPAGFQIVAVNFAINKNEQTINSTPKTLNRTANTTALTYKSASVYKSQSFIKSTISKR